MLKGYADREGEEVGQFTIFGKNKYKLFGAEKSVHSKGESFLLEIQLEEGYEMTPNGEELMIVIQAFSFL